MWQVKADFVHPEHKNEKLLETCSILFCGQLRSLYCINAPICLRGFCLEKWPIFFFWMLDEMIGISQFSFCDRFFLFTEYILGFFFSCPSMKRSLFGMRKVLWSLPHNGKAVTTCRKRKQRLVKVHICLDVQGLFKRYRTFGWKKYICSYNI